MKRPRLAAALGAGDDEIKRGLVGPGGDWRVDAVAPRIPWKLTLTHDEAVLSTRLATLRAWEIARRAETQRRARLALVLRLRHGDPALNGSRLPDLLARASVRLLPTTIEANIAAVRLDIALDGTPADAKLLREAAAGRHREGRGREVELPEFVKSLALWWHAVTGCRPERQENAIKRDDATGRASFVRFAISAGIDVSPTGAAEPLGLRSAIRRTIEELERSGKAAW